MTKHLVKNVTDTKTPKPDWCADIDRDAFEGDISLILALIKSKGVVDFRDCGDSRFIGETEVVDHLVKGKGLRSEVVGHLATVFLE